LRGKKGKTIENSGFVTMGAKSLMEQEKRRRMKGKMEGALLNLHDNLVDIYCAGRELQMRIEKVDPLHWVDVFLYLLFRIITSSLAMENDTSFLAFFSSSSFLQRFFLFLSCFVFFWL
jgi:hypothetical protein